MTTGNNGNELFDRDKISGAIDRTVGRPVRRSHSNRWITGVCGGLAESFGVDAIVIRLVIALLLVVAAPVGIVLYLGLYLVLPEA